MTLCHLSHINEVNIGHIYDDLYIKSSHEYQM